MSIHMLVWLRQSMSSYAMLLSTTTLGTATGGERACLWSRRSIEVRNGKGSRPCVGGIVRTGEDGRGRGTRHCWDMLVDEPVDLREGTDTGIGLTASKVLPSLLAAMGGTALGGSGGASGSSGLLRFRVGCRGHRVDVVPRHGALVLDEPVIDTAAVGRALMGERGGRVWATGDWDRGLLVGHSDRNVSLLILDNLMKGELLDLGWCIIYIYVCVCVRRRLPCHGHPLMCERDSSSSTSV